MKHISSELDKIAQELENKGLVHLASKVDTVSNAIDTLASGEDNKQQSLKIRETIANFIDDAIETLSTKAAVGTNPVIKKLNQAWQPVRRTYLDNPSTTGEDVLSTPAIHQFVQWAKNSTQPIADVAFIKGKNLYGTSWASIGEMFDVFTDPALGEFNNSIGDNVDKTEKFNKWTEDLKKEFSKKAGMNASLPSKYLKILSSIRALKDSSNMSMRRQMWASESEEQNPEDI